MQPPEFIRLPRTRQRCPYTGLSRSGLNNLIMPCKANGGFPPVESVSDRKRGALRGPRLIVFASLMEYLGSKKVPREKLALRRAWRIFRKEPAGPTEQLDFAGLESLPDDADESFQQPALGRSCLDRLSQKSEGRSKRPRKRRQSKNDSASRRNLR